MYDADLSASLDAVKRLRASLPLSKQSGAHQLVLAGESGKTYVTGQLSKREVKTPRKRGGVAFKWCLDPSTVTHMMDLLETGRKILHFQVEIERARRNASKTL